MKYLVLFVIGGFFFLTPSFASPHLPGRVEKEGVYRVRFGQCDIYFYMNPNKHKLSQNMIEKVNREMELNVGQTALPCLTHEILLNPNKTPEQKAIFEEYSQGVTDILKDIFGFNTIGTNCYFNLNLNWEAVKLHQDRFYKQYDFCSKMNLSPQNYSIIQDLTLIDWEMEIGTIAGTMVQNGRFGDRYILSMFPGEIVGTLYVEPTICAKTKLSSLYPGHITMPPHSTICPMDYYGSFHAGSSKGKKVSAIVRGLALNEELEILKSNAKELLLNTKRLVLGENEVYWEYDNGIIVKPLPEKTPALDLEWGIKHRDRENVEIFESSAESNPLLLEKLADLFAIDLEVYKNRKVFTLTKKDGGFSRFEKMGIEVKKDAKIILINRSILPKGYRYFNLSEDYTDRGVPWIQLYLFKPSMAMQVSPKIFPHLSLPPTEELIYRNENLDETEISDLHPTNLKRKVTNQVQVFVFSR